MHFLPSGMNHAGLSLQECTFNIQYFRHVNIHVHIHVVLVMVTFTYH